MAEKTSTQSTTIVHPMRAKFSLRRVVLALLLFILGFLLGVLFYAFMTGNLSTDRFFSQYYKTSGSSEDLDSEIETGDDAVAEDSDQCPSAEESECKVYNFPVVVFEAEGLFNAAEKNNLKARVVNPMTEYVLETEDREAVSFAIKKYDGDGDYDYSVLAIFEDGVNTGFLHGDGDAEVEWWEPTCLDTCEFSAEFEAKYPEVVEEYEN